MFHRAGCCCLCPCYYHTDPITVTVAGACNAACLEAAGKYTFAFRRIEKSGSDPLYCVLRFSYDRFDIELYHCISNGEWCAELRGGEGEGYGFDGSCANDCVGISNRTDITASVTCSGGVLSGSFSLVGSRIGPGWDCTGCTANVTL